MESAFTGALKQIRLTPDIVEWTRESLLESCREESEFRESKLKSLTARYRKLESYIFKAYEDKLEGRIDDDLWKAKTSEWKTEQGEINGQIEALRNVNTSYMLEGVKLMELVSKAADLFTSMTVDEKVRDTETGTIEPDDNRRKSLLHLQKAL